MKESELERTLRQQLRLLHVPTPQQEFVFAPPRRWRFDFAWPKLKLAVEVEGGEWTRGRHFRSAGFKADAEKYFAADLRGWRVLRFTGSQVRSWQAARTISSLLGGDEL